MSVPVLAILCGVFASVLALSAILIASLGPPQNPSVAIGPANIDPQLQSSVAKRIQDAVRLGLQRGSLDVVAVDDACEASDASCMRASSTEQGVDIRVEMDLRWTDPDLSIELRVVDRDGAVLASRTSVCELCGTSEMEEWAQGEAAALAPRIQRLGPQPGRIRVDGSPAGATVTIDGQTVGALPYEGECTPGVHEVRISSKGHVTRELEVTVDSGTDESLRVELALAPQAASMSPRARRGLGWSLLGAGLASSAAGATLWALDGSEHAGSCSADNRDIQGACPNVYTTRAAGIGTLAAGLALAISGSVLVGFSRPHRNQTIQAELGPRYLGLRGAF